MGNDGGETSVCAGVGAEAGGISSAIRSAAGGRRVDCAQHTDATMATVAVAPTREASGLPRRAQDQRLRPGEASTRVRDRAKPPEPSGFGGRSVGAVACSSVSTMVVRMACITPRDDGARASGALRRIASIRATACAPERGSSTASARAISAASRYRSSRSGSKHFATMAWRAGGTLGRRSPRGSGSASRILARTSPTPSPSNGTVPVKSS
jgi:hypothetical protein